MRRIIFLFNKYWKENATQHTFSELSEVAGTSAMYSLSWEDVGRGISSSYSRKVVARSDFVNYVLQKTNFEKNDCDRSDEEERRQKISDAIDSAMGREYIILEERIITGQDEKEDYLSIDYRGREFLKWDKFIEYWLGEHLNTTSIILGVLGSGIIGSLITLWAVLDS